MDDLLLKFTAKILGICVMWYSASCFGNIVAKTLLNEFPYPATLSMSQLTCLSIFLPFVVYFLNIPKVSKDVPWRYYYFNYIIPLSIGKFLASFTSFFSASKVPVSYAHTVKSTMPLFTVLLSRVYFGKRVTWRVLGTLCVIACGVGLSSLTELSFDLSGLLSALLSTFLFAIMSLFCKKVMDQTGIHPLLLLMRLSQISALMLFPIWVIVDFRRMLKNDALFEHSSASYCIFLLLCEGLCGVLQNTFAFTVMSLLTPVSYAVASASKRICVIILSLFFLRNPVTTFNIIGMSTAVLGVLAYNQAKLSLMHSQSRIVLPFTSSDMALVRHRSTATLENNCQSSKSNFLYDNPLLVSPPSSTLSLVPHRNVVSITDKRHISPEFSIGFPNEEDDSTFAK